jgi:hypothetical protein
VTVANPLILAVLDAARSGPRSIAVDQRDGFSAAHRPMKNIPITCGRHLVNRSGTDGCLAGRIPLVRVRHLVEPDDDLRHPSAAEPLQAGGVEADDQQHRRPA